MKAITFAAPIPRYLATLAGGRVSDRFYFGRASCTQYGDVMEPGLPSERWVRVRTLLGGICGSDLNVITLKASPSTSPFSSFPFVLGHENVGVVVAVGKEVRSVGVGTRVTVNPLLCCEPREIAPACAACAEGDHSRCEHFTDGVVAPGMLLGTTRDLGGSWGERFVAHESQVVPVPDAMSDEEAVLVEPFACSVHAVRANLPADGARVLVIGGGSIGLLTTAALRALAPRAQVTMFARHEFQIDHAKRLGVDRAVLGRADYLPALAEAAHTRLLQPIIGKPIGVGGFDQTFVCVGGGIAMEDAMRVTRAGGTIVLLGNSSTMNGVDWTPLWLKELTMRGSLCYGAHAHASPARTAFEEAMSLIGDGRAPIGPFVTHMFPLSQYRAAIHAARSKTLEECIKVTFRLTL